MSKPIHTPGPCHIKNDNLYIGQKLVAMPAAESKRGSEWVLTAEECKSNTRLLAAAFNAFDSAAGALNCNAVELAERMQQGEIAELASVLSDIIAEADGGWLHESPLAARAQRILAKVKGGAS